MYRVIIKGCSSGGGVGWGGVDLARPDTLSARESCDILICEICKFCNDVTVGGFARRTIRVIVKLSAFLTWTICGRRTSQPDCS